MDYCEIWKMQFRRVVLKDEEGFSVDQFGLDSVTRCSEDAGEANDRARHSTPQHLGLGLGLVGRYAGTGEASARDGALTFFYV